MLLKLILFALPLSLLIGIIVILVRIIRVLVSMNLRQMRLVLTDDDDAALSPKRGRARSAAWYCAAMQRSAMLQCTMRSAQGGKAAMHQRRVIL